MNKVKIIESSSPSVLEKKVNEYLKDHADSKIKIQYSSSHCVVNNNRTLSFSALVHVSSNG